MCHTSAAAQPNIHEKSASLCTTHEQTYFNCTTGKGKTLSLCGSGNVSAPAEILQYRFGTPEKVEFAYPDATSKANKTFSYAHYGRYQVERTAINFQNGGFRYTIFDSYEGDQLPATRSQGVQVMNAEGKVVATKLCKSAAVSRLSELGDSLPCDASDPLQLGECPAH